MWCGFLWVWVFSIRVCEITWSMVCYAKSYCEIDIRVIGFLYIFEEFGWDCIGFK